MKTRVTFLLGILCCSVLLVAQTADELIAKNVQAKGGLDKIKAVQSFRSNGIVDMDGMKAQISTESKRPDMLRETFTIQGMTQTEAYDGKSGWRISPFGGKKDPELMGEDELKGFVEEADFDGPLVNHDAKGNKVEYLGKESVDGDDAYRLKVTLKNGDVFNYYLDPDTFLEFRIEKQRFVRGSMRESVSEIGSYKPVGGVLYPFSIESGPKDNPASRTKFTIQKIEVNVPVEDSAFKMPIPPGSRPNPNPPEKKD